RREVSREPQRFCPGVAEVAGVGRAGHIRKRARHRTPVAAGEELPLVEREERQLVDANEEELGALILVDVILTLAVAKPRGRAVAPGDNVFAVVVAAIEFA